MSSYSQFTFPKIFKKFLYDPLLQLAYPFRTESPSSGRHILGYLWYMDLQGHSPPLSHIGTPSSSHTFHMHSIYFHCSEAKHHLHYACWISPCFIDQQKKSSFGFATIRSTENTGFPQLEITVVRKQAHLACNYTMLAFIHIIIEQRENN